MAARSLPRQPAGPGPDGCLRGEADGLEALLPAARGQAQAPGGALLPGLGQPLHGPARDRPGHPVLSDRRALPVEPPEAVAGSGGRLAARRGCPGLSLPRRAERAFRRRLHQSPSGPLPFSRPDPLVCNLRSRGVEEESDPDRRRGDGPRLPGHLRLNVEPDRRGDLSHRRRGPLHRAGPYGPLPLLRPPGREEGRPTARLPDLALRPRRRLHRGGEAAGGPLALRGERRLLPDLLQSPPRPRAPPRHRPPRDRDHAAAGRSPPLSQAHGREDRLRPPLGIGGRTAQRSGGAEDPAATREGI